MRIHCLTHVPFEDAANIGNWAYERGYPLRYTRFYGDGLLPSLDSYDLLAIMGGLMNVYEHDAYPWLITEKEYIRRAIEAGKKVIGICLGGQLIADVLGGPVRRNEHKEIGWHPVRLTREGRASALFASLPNEFTVFQWHGDTFETPPGAQNLAVSEACANQAFLYGNHVLGLQFHLEYMEESIRKMLRFCGDEMTEGPYTDTEADVLAGFHQVSRTKQYLYNILDSFASQ